VEPRSTSRTGCAAGRSRPRPTPPARSAPTVSRLGIFRVEIEPAEHLALLRDTVLVEAGADTSLGTLRARPASFVQGRVLVDGAPAGAAEIRAVEADGAKRTLRTATSDERARSASAGFPARRP
jgi:hypothetical protein